MARSDRRTIPAPFSRSRQSPLPVDFVSRTLRDPAKTKPLARLKTRGRRNTRVFESSRTNRNESVTPLPLLPRFLPERQNGRNERASRFLREAQLSILLYRGFIQLDVSDVSELS